MTTGQWGILIYEYFSTQPTQLTLLGFRFLILLRGLGRLFFSLLKLFGKIFFYRNRVEIQEGPACLKVLHKNLANRIGECSGHTGKVA